MNKATAVRIEFDNNAVRNAVQQGSIQALRNAGAYTRQTAKNLISRSSQASRPGSPPHTRKGLLKRAIRFGVDKGGLSVVVGPAESLIGITMTAHEFGGIFRKRKYPKRPLMRPALEKVAPRLPKLWANAVKN